MNVTCDLNGDEQSGHCTTTAGGRLAPAQDAGESPRALSRRAHSSLRTATRLAGQYALVYGIFLVGSHAVQFLHLPLPPSLAGVLLFLLLLVFGVVTPEQMRELSDLIGAHLAFFFIPLVVMGVVSWAGVLIHVWLVLGVALLASVVVGIVASGLAAQAMQGFRNGRRASECKR